MKKETVLALILGITSLSINLPASAETNADAARNWQLSLLFNPGPQQLEIEKKGRVMIYDNMRSADIERVLDEQFDRVDHMMFTNTIVTDAGGSPVKDPETGLAMVEEDGCD